jgi:signal transduction histidine kinase
MVMDERDSDAAKRSAEVAAENQRMRDQLRAMNEFMANLSHELATPLTPLVGYLKLLSSGRLGELSVKQQQVVDVMVHAAERLGKSIDNLVDYAALETGRSTIDKREFDASATLEAWVREHHAKARGRHVRIDVRRPARLTLVGDERKLRLAFGHVLDNGIRFSPHGGHVLVELGEAGSHATFSVYDQGPGMTDEQRALALQPSRKADERGSHAGLGLPVARQIVESHGGLLWIESPPKMQPEARELFSGAKVAFSVPRPLVAAS